jgi:hypothetical protein
MMGHRPYLFGYNGDSGDLVDIVRGYGSVDLER